jgi:hypothetical protein
VYYWQYNIIFIPKYKQKLHLPSSKYRSIWLRVLYVFSSLSLSWLNSSIGSRPPQWGSSITLRHTTLGRTPLDEWSARCRYLYLITHNNHWRQTSMSSPVDSNQRSQGAHTRTSLASESGWARVPVSQTGLCVEFHEPDFGRLYPSLSPESSSTRRTRKPDSYV